MTDNYFIEIVVTVHAETDHALLVSDTGQEADGVWLPKTQITAEKHRLGHTTVFLPEWLALDRGLA